MLDVINKKAVAIEYPRQNEIIISNTYTFRIVAMPGVQKVEISINGSGWEACRYSEDSWWYDWSGYGSGEYELAARMLMSNGHYHATEPRFFAVELEYDRVQGSTGEHRTFRRRTHGRAVRPELQKHMAEKFVVVTPNQPAVLRQLTQLLSQEGVNVDSFLMETIGEVVSFRFLIEKENGLRRVLESEGFHVVDDKVFRLDLASDSGELGRLTRRLIEQGVAIRYLYGTSYGRTTKVVLSVDRPEDAAGVMKEFNHGLIAA